MSDKAIAMICITILTIVVICTLAEVETTKIKYETVYKAVNK